MSERFLQDPYYWDWVRYFHENGLPELPEELEDPVEEPEPDPDVPRHSFDQCAYMVIGAQGDQVVALQEVLKFLGLYVGRLDGDYGPMTANAVREFQKAEGLYVDGEFGPKSIQTLDILLQSMGGYFSCGTTSTVPVAGTTKVTKTFLRKDTAFETPIYTYDSPNPGPTLVMVGGIHGNEKSGHLGLLDAIDRGITISEGRLVIVPSFNKIALQQNRRTMNRSSSSYHGKDFNRMFPVGKTPSYAIAKELWDLIRSQNDLAFVLDFHDGFINSLGNTLVRSRQSKASSACAAVRNALNKIRPSGARGPVWRHFTEPISGSLARKVGRDLNVPAATVELSGRNPGDPLSLRKQYVFTIMREFGKACGMNIQF